jgi:hypothetical protein
MKHKKSQFNIWRIANIANIAKIFAKTLLQEMQEISGKNVFKSALNFAKYHNGFAVIIAVAILATGSVIASEDGRDMLANVVGQEIIVKNGIDNSQLLALDLDNFDLEMTILRASEDLKN